MKTTTLTGQLFIQNKVIFRLLFFKSASIKLLLLGIIFISVAFNSHAQQVSIGMPSDATEGLNHVSFVVSLGGGTVNTTSSPITGSLFFLGSATNGVDYTGPTTYSIPVGANSATLIFLVTDDAILEQSEQVTVSLGTPNFGTIGNALSSAWIFDNEMAITSIGSPIDGTEGSSDVSFSIFLEGGLSNTIGLPITGTINFSGTATNGLDYTGVSSYTIPVGANSITITVSLIDDLISEVTETVIGTISSPNFGTIGTTLSTANIIDNDGVILVNSIAVQGQSAVSTITTQGGTLPMEATVLPANTTDATYTWSVTNGTGSASIDAGGFLTAITDGTVTVTATANDASGVTGSTVITISNQSNVGINESTSLHNLSIYPNPVNSILRIDSDVKIKTISIIDITGKTAETNVMSNNTINVSDLTKGVYFLQIQTDKGLVSKKFIKE